jgi:hypothetical protein
VLFAILMVNLLSLGKLFTHSITRKDWNRVPFSPPPELGFLF